MGTVIQFPAQAEEAVDEIDLYTAVDAAIRDLRDIARLSDDAAVRERSDECRQMLQSAYARALSTW